jgi:hypothetical protein
MRNEEFPTTHTFRISNFGYSVHPPEIQQVKQIDTDDFLCVDLR